MGWVLGQGHAGGVTCRKGWSHGGGPSGFFQGESDAGVTVLLFPSDWARTMAWLRPVCFGEGAYQGGRDMKVSPRPVWPLA